jgi:hypothetical protein
VSILRVLLQVHQAFEQHNMKPPSMLMLADRNASKELAREISALSLTDLMSDPPGLEVRMTEGTMPILFVEVECVGIRLRCPVALSDVHNGHVYLQSLLFASEGHELSY